MRVGLLAHPPGLSEYVGELLSLWGIVNVQRIAPGDLQALEPTQIPVLILPVGSDQDISREVLAYADRGGVVLSLLPGADLLRAIGITVDAHREGPQRLRLTALPMAGLAGESLVVVGPAQRWSLVDEAVDGAVGDTTKSLAEMYAAGLDDGNEAPGIVRRSLGAGVIIAFAFDLPRAVLMLRQGDPANAESGGRADGPARPTHLACDAGTQEPDWIPYADLLGRLLVDLVTWQFPAPLPHLWHLPAGAAGLVVYSGDEDGAEVAWNRTQFDEMTAAGGRMNLYMIPGNTKSTAADAAMYGLHHDLGPHPNIRPLDGAPVAARVAEMARQIRQFEDQFKVSPRTLRNHCVSWAGYLEPVQAMADCGVGMEGNYFCSTFLKDRGYAPYAAFGAAMPMRFCHADGSLLSVRQQHTHTMDDIYFGPEWIAYSLHMSPALWESVLARVLDDVASRFHVPHATCIHPSNWVRFSRDQGLAIVQLALARNLPVWSFDQWLTFLDTRESWRCDSLRWDSNGLQAEFSGTSGPFSLVLPRRWRTRELVELTVDGGIVESARYFGQHVDEVRIEGSSRVRLTAQYAPSAAH